MRSIPVMSLACVLVACGGAAPVTPTTPAAHGTPATPAAPAAPAAPAQAAEPAPTGIHGKLFDAMFAGTHAVYAQVDPSAAYGTLRVHVAGKPLDCGVIADRDDALRKGGIAEILTFDLKPLKAGPKDGSYPLAFGGPITGYRLRLTAEGVTSGAMAGTLDLVVKPEGVIVKLPDGKIGNGGAVVVSGAVLATKCPTKGK